MVLLTDLDIHDERTPLLAIQSSAATPHLCGTQRKKWSKCCKIFTIAIAVVLILVGVGGFAAYKLVPPIIQSKIDTSPPPVLDKLTIMELSDSGVLAHVEGHLYYPIPEALNVIGFDVKLESSAWNITTSAWPNGTETETVVGQAVVPEIFVKPGNEHPLDLMVKVVNIDHEYLRQFTSGSIVVPAINITAATKTNLSMFNGRFFWETIGLHSRHEVVLKANESTEGKPNSGSNSTNNNNEFWKKLNFTIKEQNKRLMDLSYDAEIEFDNPANVEAKDLGYLLMEIHYDHEPLADVAVYNMNIWQKNTKKSSFHIGVQLRGLQSLKTWSIIAKKQLSQKRPVLTIKHLRFTAKSNDNQTRPVAWINNILEPVVANFTLPEIHFS
ncbi:hypothetical protein MP638_004597 [Amoeboaphelidium occidentale]|nr:hypothetical protein MP638_004597 [Amoeboaphelidium occidentale]